MQHIKRTTTSFLVICLILIFTSSSAQNEVQYEIGASINTIFGGGYPSILLKKRAKRFDRFWRYGLTGFSHYKYADTYSFSYQNWGFAKNRDAINGTFFNGGRGYQTSIGQISLGLEQRYMLNPKFQWYKALNVGLGYSRYLTEGFTDVESEGINPSDFIISKYWKYKDVSHLITPQLGAVIGLEYSFNRNFKAFAETGIGVSYSYAINKVELSQNIWNYSTLAFNEQSLIAATNGKNHGFRIGLDPRVDFNIAYTFTRKKD